ncbi:MAG: DNA gyrase inhibitor YacG, partial [Ramlibacter sp.]|nr:DNA gyrase inhibitor YacG [Ramlibacter sp.]
PFRPFCSERCKSMDFGAWASENFRVANNDDPASPDDFDATSQ